MANSTTKIIVFILILLGASKSVQAAGFENPLLISSDRNCEIGNISSERFSSEILPARQVKICQSVEAVINRLNEGTWSAHLDAELREVWQVWLEKKVFFSVMPPKTGGEVIALTESVGTPSAETSGEGGFMACIRLKNGVEEKKWFYTALLHELRHVFDFYEIWQTSHNLPGVELERRAFWLMSEIDQETPKSQRFTKLPQLWKDKWNQYAANLREYKREEAITKYLKAKVDYRDLYSPAAGQFPTGATTAAVAANGSASFTSESEFGNPPKLVRKSKTTVMAATSTSEIIGELPDEIF